MAPNTTDQPRFTNNGDGTVTDNTTGLTWTQATIAQVVDHDEALQAVSALGEGWRLPTLEELLSIVDRGTYAPAIDAEAFPDTPSRAFWTTDSCAWSDTAVWVVYFYDGTVYDSPRGSSACVRAVRSGQ